MGTRVNKRNLRREDYSNVKLIINFLCKLHNLNKLRRSKFYSSFAYESGSA